MEELATHRKHRFSQYPLHKMLWTQVQTALLNKLHLDQDVKVLDVGCGVGEYGHFLRERDFQGEYVGVDSSFDFIRIARSQALSKSKFFFAEAENLPFARNSFDVVFSLFSMHDWWNPRQALQEIRRVLSSDGKLILLDLHNDGFLGKIASKLERSGGGYGFFSRDHVQQFLQECGFQKIYDQEFRKVYNLWIVG